jgi:hypothetical protein
MTVKIQSAIWLPGCALDCNCVPLPLLGYSVQEWNSPKRLKLDVVDAIAEESVDYFVTVG